MKSPEAQRRPLAPSESIYCSLLLLCAQRHLNPPSAEGSKATHGRKRRLCGRIALDVGRSCSPLSKQHGERRLGARRSPFGCCRRDPPIPVNRVDGCGSPARTAANKARGHGSHGTPAAFELPGCRLPANQHPVTGVHGTVQACPFEPVKCAHTKRMGW